MEPFDQDELSDRELDELLPEWQTPPAPAHLRDAIFPRPQAPWWRKLWSASIRLPLPVAACLAMALGGLSLWQAVRPPRVVVETRTVPVIQERRVAVERPAPPPPKPVRPAAPAPLLPVAELRPRIVRGADGEIQ